MTSVIGMIGIPHRRFIKNKCIYPNCTSAYYSNLLRNKHFYTFPNNKSRCRQKFRIKWCQALQIQPDTVVSRSSRICEDHFREKDFVNEMRLRLVWNAVPIPVPFSNSPSIANNNISEEPEIAESNGGLINLDKAASITVPEVPTVDDHHQLPNVENDVDSDNDEIKVHIIYSSDEEEEEEEPAIVEEFDPLQLNAEIDLDKPDASVAAEESGNKELDQSLPDTDGIEIEVSALCAISEDEESDIEVEIIYSDEESEVLDDDRVASVKASAKESVPIRATEPKGINYSPYDVRRKRKSGCVYSNCKNGYYTNSLNKHFYGFPVNLEMCNKWLEALQIPADYLLKNHRICEDHFLESSFVNSLKKRLNRNAIPIPVDSNLPTTESAAEKLG